MSTETDTLTKEAPSVSALPESIRTAMPKVENDYGAGSFFKDEPANKTSETKPETKSEETVVPDAKVAGVSLAEKWAARVRPAKTPEKVEDKPEPKPVEKSEVKSETKPETNPEDKLDLDQRSSPAARDNFKTLKTITKGLRDQVISREKELNDIRSRYEALSKTPPPSAAPVDTSELEKLRLHNKEMSDRLLLLDTRNHPTFQNQYIKPRQEALQVATELLKANGKDSDLASLIEKPRGEIGKALQEILKDLPPLDQTEISQNVNQAWKLSQAEKKALSDAGSVNGAIKQQDEQTHLQAFDRTWQKVGGQLSEMFDAAEPPANATEQQRQGIAEYNAAMASLKDNAKKIATGKNSFEGIAESSIKAAAYDLHMQHVMPRIGVEVQTMLDIIRAQEKKLKDYESRNPNREISAAPSKSGRDTPNEAKSIEELASSMFPATR